MERGVPALRRSTGVHVFDSPIRERAATSAWERSNSSAEIENGFILLKVEGKAGFEETEGSKVFPMLRTVMKPFATDRKISQI